MDLFGPSTLKAATTATKRRRSSANNNEKEDDDDDGTSNSSESPIEVKTPSRYYESDGEFGNSIAALAEDNNDNRRVLLQGCEEKKPNDEHNELIQSLTTKEFSKQLEEIKKDFRRAETEAQQRQPQQEVAAPAPAATAAEKGASNAHVQQREITAKKAKAKKNCYRRAALWDRDYRSRAIDAQPAAEAATATSEENEDN